MLLASGTVVFFHDDGYSVGALTRLLDAATGLASDRAASASEETIEDSPLL